MTVQRKIETQAADSKPPLLRAADQASRPMTLTVLTSAQPARLTKVLSLVDGKLKKEASASMQKGRAQRVQARDLAELAQLLDGLTEAQAVAWGVCAHESVDVVPQDEEAATRGAIARTRRHFSYPPTSGVLMLDHDGAPGEELDAATLRQRLIDAAPALASAPMLWRPSVSAGVRAPDGSVLTGLTRHRIYIPVVDASRIPEAGKALLALLWAAGHGWIEIGRAGQALERTLVDGSVWQPERIDFAAPPVLLDGLTREGVAPVVHGDGAALFDLVQLVADTDTLKRADAAKKAAREATKAACAEQRERWAAEHAPQLAKRRGITQEKAREVLKRAAERAVLMGDFELIAQDGTTVTVGEVLDQADRWHNARFADPLDPDTDRRVAMVNLRSGGRPYLYSHRHGGVRYELMRQSARVQIGRGMRIATTDAVLAVLQARGELFEFGEGSLAYVSEGRARTVSLDWMVDHLGRAVDFYSVKLRQDGESNAVREEIPEDAPMPVARAILAKHGSRGLRKLMGVTTAPTLRTDGSILDVPGHDETSGLLYWSELPSPPRVPAAPTPADALAALRLLWQPVKLFPLVDDVARGVVLHGLLTAALRASLPTAPGVGLDAPAAGSGKTLLARCMGILATGTDPSILPPADTDEETRKRLFAVLREGQRVVLWDNVREPLGCAALDSFLTASTFSDRILGSSETASLPNRSLFLATGNNLRLSSDTCRRVLVARMDAETERPYTRDFDFDPAQVLLARRLEYVVAALTIVRAYITAGRPKMARGRTASFEAWDDLVRQPVCWLAQLVHAAGAADLPTLADPMEAAAQAFEADPETTKHAALLATWCAAFGSKPTTVAAAVSRAITDEELHVALDEIAGQGGKINTRILGRWIERMQGRRVGGLWFTRGPRRATGQCWEVKREAADGQPHKPHQHHLAGVSGGAASAGGVVCVVSDVSGALPACVGPATSDEVLI